MSFQQSVSCAACEDVGATHEHDRSQVVRCHSVEQHPSSVHQHENTDTATYMPPQPQGSIAFMGNRATQPSQFEFANFPRHGDGSRSTQGTSPASLLHWLTLVESLFGGMEENTRNFRQLIRCKKRTKSLASNHKKYIEADSQAPDAVSGQVASRANQYMLHGRRAFSAVLDLLIKEGQEWQSAHGKGQGAPDGCSLLCGSPGLHQRPLDAAGQHHPGGGSGLQPSHGGHAEPRRPVCSGTIHEVQSDLQPRSRRTRTSAPQLASEPSSQLSRMALMDDDNDLTCVRGCCRGAHV